MADSAPTVGDVAAEFIGAELAAENTRKASLESRGLAVITSSGGLVTLLLGFGALVTGATGYKLTPPAGPLIVVAALLFVAAAVLAVLSNSPVPYRRVEPNSLNSLLTRDAWQGDGAEAKRELTAARLVQLASARSGNDTKAIVVVIAIIVEISAVAVTAVAVAALLLNG